MTDIQLEPFESDDIPRLISWIPSEEFMIQWSGHYFLYPITREQVEAYLKSVEKSPPNRAIFRAREMDHGQIIGHIELNNIDWRNNGAAMSKVLIGSKEMRGCGAGHQMVSRLLEYAFGELHLHRVELRVFDDNPSAIRCYEQNGFVIEGHLRDYRKVRYSYNSSYLMSILEPDWRQRMPEKEQEIFRNG